MNVNQVKPYPIISKNNCKACLRCISACKEQCLKLSEEINDSGYLMIADINMQNILEKAVLVVEIVTILVRNH